MSLFRGIAVLAVLAAVAIIPACGDDTTKPITRCMTCLLPELSKKSDVLKDIEYAYNKRNMPTYDELLDDNFTFFYTEGDAGSGGTPVQWGRSDEVTTTSGLLAAADKIDLTIDWKDAYGKSTVVWTEQIAGTETWYYTTVFYHFTIKIGTTTYIPNAGSKAKFTVRNAGTAEAPKWRLVEFHDLGAPSLLNAMSIATQPTTWGAVKAKYRP